MEQGFKERKPVFPYCTAMGLMEILALMRESTLPKIDNDLLHQYEISSGDGHKVIGALRVLGLIDEEGRPTERSQVLKAKDSSGRRQIVENAYSKLFQWLGPNPPSSEKVFEYFDTVENLAPSMAEKATRAFIYLCQWAEIKLAPKTRIIEKPARTLRKRKDIQRKERAPRVNLNLTFLITPEAMEMEPEKVVRFFRNLRKALASEKE